MKFESTLEQLVDGVSIAAHITTHHQTLPILQCVLLTAQKGMVKIRATNLEIGVEVQCAAKITTEGSAVVPSDALLNTLLNSYGSATILCELTQNSLILKTPTST